MVQPKKRRLLGIKKTTEYIFFKYIKHILRILSKTFEGKN